MLETILERAVREERGVAATEYALIASIIAVAVASAIASLGTEVGTQYDGIETAVREAAPHG